MGRMILNVLILTAQRPRVFARCLEAVEKSLHLVKQHANKMIPHLFVIDDSKDEFARKANRRAMNRIYLFESAVYVERGLQANLVNSVIRKNKLKRSVGNRFFHPLGTKDVDVSAHRNLGVLAVREAGRSTGLLWFVDDDIVVSHDELEGFTENLTKRVTPKLWGPKLKGIVDESSLERLLRSVGLDPQFGFHLDEKYLSGGCMFVDFDIARRVPFPRLYNEDWIFQSIVQKLYNVSPVFSKGSVYHLPGTNPINGDIGWIKRELDGDVMIDAINEARNNQTISVRWIEQKKREIYELLMEQERTIIMLNKMSRRGDLTSVMRKVRMSLDHLSNPDLPRRLHALYTQYRRDIQVWQRLMS